ncbi:hypothetical protein F3Y22_tig00110472pilonHSYRG00197 [Hibiscus syriacus]|uniref:Uncharacterized protein n=1 Tax=Hibiscus syriacus TaxID=106335 RepID=A0A6A3AK44_HIBSY|nr:hypothetical protein F3Y22_tig00110472pilonHSYRG00197 [Hibiscus syriacus]
MDLERPHRSNSINNISGSSSNATNELFICFFSRLSSSSMKFSSKSILSPGRAREPSQISLSSSLTRRLKTNGSMQGGQASPMFPTNGKKRGCAFENPEPSSPKVTCIGQVRVKTNKQGKKFRACGSKRRGEVSFRKVENVNGSLDTSSCQGHVLSSNKKWVHLPMTICEALRAFGAEFNCFLPCRSSCMASQRDKEEKARGSGGGSCGTVCARWLVAVQEGEGKGKEIELVVGGGEDDERRESVQRRHVFEDIVISDFGNKNVGDEDEKGGEAARVSICIPPKNALLLMRCRSDPVKMAALANKFWETPSPKDKEQQEDEQEEQEEVEAENGSDEKYKEQEEDEEEQEEAGCEEKEDQEDGDVEVEGEESKVESFEEAIEHQEASEVSEMFVSGAATEEQEIPETEAEPEAESVLARDETNEVEEEILGTNSKEETIIECQDQEEEETEVEELQANENASAEAEEEEGSTSTIEEEETEMTHERSESKYQEMKEPDLENESKEGQEKILPDCLLLMMCEPKLSMEVSKETWVCSTDFIRCVLQKKKNQHQQQQQSEAKQKDCRDQSKTRISIDRNPAPILLHPPRSSCSFPAAPPMATAAVGGGGPTIDKKLVGGKGYESFFLTRCKSEPRRSSAKLAPDVCFWNNRKLQPAALGVGAAGVGF